MHRLLSRLPAAATAAEEGMLAALRTAEPAAVPRYRAALPRARAAGLGRLWRAVAAERFAGARPRDTAWTARLLLPDGTVLTAPASVVAPFTTDETGLTVTVRRPDGTTAAAGDPVALLTWLEAACERVPPEAWRALRGEAAESVANHALALVGEERRRERLTERTAPRGQDRRSQGRAGADPAARCGRGAPARAARLAADDPAFSPLAWFEQAVVDGHPLHPFARIRGGMAPQDLLAWGPEWNDVVPVALAAVAAGSFAARRPGPEAVLQGGHPVVSARARAALRRRGLDEDAYVLLPLHPWQLERVVPVRFGEAVADGRIVPLPEVGLPGRPLISFRTFACATDRRAAHVKTAVDVRLTSAVRTVSPAAAHNGPALSALLRRVAGAERGWGGRFGVCEEYAGGGFAPAPGEPAVPSLTAVLRRSPEAGLEAGEIAVPVAALAACSPMTGRPVAAELLDAAPAPGPEADRATAFAADACACALPPLLTLLVRWGIGLEPHGENLVLVVRDGRPVRALYRDFGGVRVHAGRLAAAGLRPPGLRGAVPAAGEDELRTKALFPLVVTGLGQLVAALAHAGGTCPGPLWTVVRRTARDVFDALAGDPSVRRRAREDEEAMFAPTLPVKAMLATQLSGTPHNARWVDAPNPLAGR